MAGLEDNDYVAISTFIDPRFIVKHFSSKDKCYDVRRKVAEAAQHLYLAVEDIESNDVVNVSKRYKLSHGNHSIYIFSMLNDSEDEETDDTRENTPIGVFTDRYVAEPRILSDADPFAWWNANKHLYVSLNILARYLPFCATNQRTNRAAFQQSWNHI